MIASIASGLGAKSSTVGSELKIGSEIDVDVIMCIFKDVAFADVLGRLRRAFHNVFDELGKSHFGVADFE